MDQLDAQPVEVTGGRGVTRREGVGGKERDLSDSGKGSRGSARISPVLGAGLRMQGK